jgi:hypothetical protein
MVYVLGSQVESMVITDDGIDYQPAGIAHAVDVDDEINAAGGVVGYALCGAPVRIWRDMNFDPDGSNVHDDCVARASRA